MSDRFIFSLRFFSKTLLRLGILSVVLVLFMTLFRVNLYFLSVYHATPQASFMEIIESFFVGLRFDFLVFGFVFLPVYFCLLVQATMQNWPRQMFFIYKFYYGAVWVWICALTFSDFFFFSRHGVRMRFNDYMSFSGQEFIDLARSLRLDQSLIFCVITAILFGVGFNLIKSIKFGEWKDEYSPFRGTYLEVTLRILLPLLLIVFAARGTIGPQHLNFENSVVSNLKPLNEMALNAVWCFDK